MIKKFLLSLEDPNRPLLGPNIWMLKKIGMIVPDNQYVKYAYIVLHEIVTFFVITQFMELYVIRSDLDQVLNNLKLSMVSLVCVVKSNTCVAWQNSWREVIEYITFADKEEREDMDMERKTILNKYTTYARKITNFYWILVLITLVTTISTPYLKYITEIYIEKLDPAERKDDIEHILSSWMPFDKNHYPGSWITVAWHTFVCAYGAASIAAFDVTVMVMMVFFGGKIDLLCERCQLVLGTTDSALSEEESDKIFRKLHRTHVLMMKYSRMLNSLLSPIMFLYVVIGSLVLCASAYQLTLATNATQKIFMTEYLLFGIAQLFMYCWHSNDVLYKSTDLLRGPYRSEWWLASNKHRRCIVLLTGQLNRPIFFTAGPFTNLTLPIFISILKGAYSYYTLLRK